MNKGKILVKRNRHGRTTGARAICVLLAMLLSACCCCKCALSQLQLPRTPWAHRMFLGGGSIDGGHRFRWHPRVGGQHSGDSVTELNAATGALVQVICGLQLRVQHHPDGDLAPTAPMSGWPTSWATRSPS